MLHTGESFIVIVITPSVATHPFIGKGQVTGLRQAGVRYLFRWKQRLGPVSCSIVQCFPLTKSLKKLIIRLNCYIF